MDKKTQKKEEKKFANKMTMNERHRNWQFTWHNYTDEDIEYLDNLETKYLQYEKKYDLKTGTPYLQGMLCWINAKSLSKTTKLLKNHHCKVVNSIQHKKYNEEDDDVYEKGKLPNNQGKRSDLDEIGKMIKDKKTMSEIAEKYPSQVMRYHNGIEKVRNYILSTDRTTKPDVFWYWGNKGSGKTHAAKKISNNYYIKKNNKWWNNYNFEDVIIIDDFEPCSYNYRELLLLLDENKYDGETKGGYVSINSGTIVITCEEPPYNFWEGNKLWQVLRRINEVICFNKPSLKNVDENIQESQKYS